MTSHDGHREQVLMAALESENPQATLHGDTRHCLQCITELEELLQVGEGLGQLSRLEKEASAEALPKVDAKLQEAFDSALRREAGMAGPRSLWPRWALLAAARPPNHTGASTPPANNSIAIAPTQPPTATSATPSTPGASGRLAIWASTRGSLLCLMTCPLPRPTAMYRTRTAG